MIAIEPSAFHTPPVPRLPLSHPSHALPYPHPAPPVQAALGHAAPGALSPREARWTGCSHRQGGPPLQTTFQTGYKRHWSTVTRHRFTSITWISLPERGGDVRRPAPGAHGAGGNLRGHRRGDETSYAQRNPEEEGACSIAGRSGLRNGHSSVEMRSRSARHAMRVFRLCMEHLMHEGDGNRALPHRRRHPLDIAAPDVADRETRQADWFRGGRRSCVATAGRPTPPGTDPARS